MEHESDWDTNFNWYVWNDTERFGDRAGRVRMEGRTEVIPNYSIVLFSQNTKKSPGDLRKFAVTQTPMENSANADVKNSSKSKLIREDFHVF